MFDEKGIKNILTPLPEPTKTAVDWPKVEVDTPILVRDQGGTWYKRHFARYENGKVRAWDDGATSFTGVYTKEWDYAKIAEVAE